MKVLIFNSAPEAIKQSSEIVANHIRKKPETVLGLATGGTMLPLYEQLCTEYQRGDLSFARVSSFNLDEYVGLGPDHPCSYHHYMRNVLFNHVDISPSRTHLPRGDSPDPSMEAVEYEARIAMAGGIDLQLLGIGQNGHIGFNEPTSSLASRTRIKTLTDDTRRANQRYFASFEETPRFALTMGVGTILESRLCVLVATGRAKSAAVAAMIEGPVSASCPASALQFHANATVVLDRDAAAELKFGSYYQHVHPEGLDIEVVQPR